MYFLSVIKEKLNATVKYNFVERNIMKHKATALIFSIAENLSANGSLDFFLDFYPYLPGALYSYKQVDLCYRLGKPPKYSITELVLFLPFDE